MMAGAMDRAEFLRRAKQAHPDVGGSHDEMVKLNAERDQANAWKKAARERQEYWEQQTRRGRERRQARREAAEKIARAEGLWESTVHAVVYAVVGIGSVRTFKTMKEAEAYAAKATAASRNKLCQEILKRKAKGRRKSMQHE
jgi:hypothetical protein